MKLKIKGHSPKVGLKSGAMNLSLRKLDGITPQNADWHHVISTSTPSKSNVYKKCHILIIPVYRILNEWH